jgi:hypothetical protein
MYFNITAPSRQRCSNGKTTASSVCIVEPHVTAAMYESECCKPVSMAKFHGNPSIRSRVYNIRTDKHIYKYNII